MNKSVLSYEQAIEYLYGRVNFEKTLTGQYSRRDFKLDRMKYFLEQIGNPQDRIPVIHIAGTKGKGSTCNMVASILSEAGYQTGLFSSPHLFSFEERFQVNQNIPSRQDVISLLNQLLPTINQMDQLPGSMSPTFFEIVTAMAWIYFEQSQIEIAVLEVGLGGRLDTTNICNSIITAITNISRDHSEILGATLEEIASEKAGIAKTKVPLICGDIQTVPLKIIENICSNNDSPILKTKDIYNWTEETVSGTTYLSFNFSNKEWNNLPVPLFGQHQVDNTLLAITIIEQLTHMGWNINEEQVKQGLQKVNLPIRMEKVMDTPLVFVDAAHNWASIRSLLSTLDQIKTIGKKILIFGSTRDKDILGILRNLIPKFDTIILTKYSNNSRASEIEELQRMVRELSHVPIHVCDNPSSAWQLAKYISHDHDLICVTGSFFIAAEIRQIIVELPVTNPEKMTEKPVK